MTIGWGLDGGELRAVVDAARGGRIASITIDGVELLAPPGDERDLLLWGCYPMVPWAGRVRRGRFAFDGVSHQLDVDLPPHAIHGLGYRATWDEVAPGVLRLDLEGRWPFGGEVEQRISVLDTAVEVTMRVTARRRMPVMAGWHPCLRRRLGVGGPAELSFAPGYLWERDAEGIPTGRRIPVPAGPWDDCFGEVTAAPVVTWPGVGSLRIDSDVEAWVVYDEHPEVVCVEPQTQAPDAFNRRPRVLEAGTVLDVAMRLTWIPEQP